MKEFSIDINNQTRIHILCSPEKGVTNFGDQVFDRPEELEKFLTFQSFEHRIQYLLKLHLLKKTGLKNDLYYDSAGKPHLHSNGSISISHSGKCVAVVISNKATGIDIQRIDERVKTLKTKYLNEKDKLPFRDEKDFYHYAWTAKEAVYKACGQKGLSLKNDIFLYERNGQTYAWCDPEGIFRLFFKQFDNYYMAVAYKE